MKKNYISVLITNFNKKKFLEKSLNSVSNQEFKNYEVILFDDFSTDDSKKIIKKYKKIKLLENKKKINRSAPLNQINGIYKAFLKSKGNIICLMDADDYFDKNKLQIVNLKFNNYSHINSLYNLPITINKNFTVKKKKFFHSLWPTIFPTSCISVTRKSFEYFLKYLKPNQYPNLEIDARLTIFYYFILNEYNILDQKLTKYNHDENGITAKIKKYDKHWWLRRKDGYDYLKFILKKRKKGFFPNLDYLVTEICCFLINKFNR